MEYCFWFSFGLKWGSGYCVSFKRLEIGMDKYAQTIDTKRL